MKRLADCILWFGVGAIVLAMAVLVFGCASLPGKLNPEFAFTVMEFVTRDLTSPSGQRVVEPVFYAKDAVVLYFVLANVTTVDGKVYLTAEAAILDSMGEVLEFRKVMDYEGNELTEWWLPYYPRNLAPGNYVFYVTIVDMLGPHTITETLDFKIIAGSFI